MKCPDCNGLLLENDMKVGKYGQYLQCGICNRRLSKQSREYKKLLYIDENKGDW